MLFSAVHSDAYSFKDGDFYTILSIVPFKTPRNADWKREYMTLFLSPLSEAAFFTSQHCKGSVFAFSSAFMFVLLKKICEDASKNMHFQYTLCMLGLKTLELFCTFFASVL